MTIVYHGAVEQVRRELDAAQEVLCRAYAEVLGAYESRRLKDASSRLLGPDCFFDSIDSLNNSLGTNLPADACNKMTVATTSDAKLDLEGRISLAKIKTAPLFYISKRGFENSGSATFTESPLASFVHEFDHFVWYALQRTPAYLVNLFIGSTLNPASEPFSYQNYRAQVDQEGHPPEEKRRRLLLALYFHMMTEIYEKANRILDSVILRHVGIEVPLPWRQKGRKFAAVIVPPATIAAVPVDGDPFQGLDDREVIKRFMAWETYFNCRMAYEPVLNLVDSVKNIKVSRHPLRDLLKNRKKRNHQ